MNLNSFFLIILTILFLSCLVPNKKDSSAISSNPEKKQGPFVDEKMIGLKPSKELKLSSILYRLAGSPEPEKFAKENDIILTEGKVKVFIYFNPDALCSDMDKLAEKYIYGVEKKTSKVFRALVPIDSLVPLSKEAIIWSIKLPDRAIKQ